MTKKPRPFSFKSKILRLPMTDAARIFFEVPDDLPMPETYTVKVGIKSCVWECVVVTPDGWRNTYQCKTHNPLRLEKRSTVR